MPKSSPEMDIGAKVGAIASALSGALASTTAVAINGVARQGCGQWFAAATLASGAATGPLQMLAAVLTDEKDGKTVAQGVTNDTMLFAALLTAASLDVSHPADAPDAVNNHFVQDPTTFQTAISMFEKVTG